MVKVCWFGLGRRFWKLRHCIGQLELCCCYDSTLWMVELCSGEMAFSSQCTQDWYFGDPPWACVQRECEEMHCRGCVTSNQVAECRFRSWTAVFWANFGDACLTWSWSKVCQKFSEDLMTTSQCYAHPNILYLSRCMSKKTKQVSRKLL